MRSEVRGVICAGICTLLFPSGSQATIITFLFDAEVTAIGQVNSFGGVLIGDTFSGSYTFDSTVTGTGAPGTKKYDFTGGSLGLTAQVGTESVVLTDYFIQIQNNISGPPTDVYQVEGATGPAQSDTFFRFVLFDTSGSVFSDESLPLTPPPLASFNGENNEVRKQFPTTTNPLTIFTITSLTLIPEPSTALLLASGLAALAVGRRRGNP